MAVLLAEFGTYLTGERADPAADQVGYRQHAVWLSPAERDRLISALREAILPVLAHTPAPGRVPHMLSPILFPLLDPPAPAPLPASGPADSAEGPGPSEALPLPAPGPAGGVPAQDGSQVGDRVADSGEVSGGAQRGLRQSRTALS
jgi:hypothetical protein